MEYSKNLLELSRMYKVTLILILIHVYIESLAIPQISKKSLMFAKKKRIYVTSIYVKINEHEYFKEFLEYRIEK